MIDCGCPTDEMHSMLAQVVDSFGKMLLARIHLMMCEEDGPLTPEMMSGAIAETCAHGVRGLDEVATLRSLDFETPEA